MKAAFYEPNFVDRIERLYIDGVDVSTIAELLGTDDETVNDVIDQLID
jgi:hypothetical protein